MKMLTQKEFWNQEALKFDAIYSRHKSKFSVFLDRLFRWAMYERFHYTLEQCEPINEKTFLDVGCGTGLYSLELARRGAIQVTGIDVAEKMIGVSNRKASQEELDSRTRFIQVDIMNFESTTSFDITIGMGLLDYIKDPLPVLKRMRKCTTDRVMLSFPVLWSWRTLPRIIRLGLKRCPVYFYTMSQVRSLMKEAGFNHCNIKQMGPMYFIIGW